ncbi:hypothetical protein AX16_002582 [Volvariella volvacea WC 439]|nr:hypothetical protein AX16_002582 [Volvariella volvacea WC 439]
MTPNQELAPVFVQALRLARAEACPNIDKLPDEANIPTVPPSTYEQGILARNARLVGAWEDLFSYRHKDRTSKTTQLSAAESLRFQRALYRIMLVSLVFGMSATPEFTTSVDRSSSHVSGDGQRTLLNQFSSQELIQIERVANFLKTIGRWIIHIEGSAVGALDSYDFDGLWLFAGPEFILRCYEEGGNGFSDLQQFLGDAVAYEGFLLRPVHEILKERGDYHQPPPGVAIRALLDHINGDTDECSHCKSEFELFPGMKRGVNLWNETNWDYIRGYIYMELPYYIPGKLSENQTEIGLSKTLRSMDFLELMTEMLECRGNEYQGWNKQKWVCFDCLGDFFTDTIPAWWLARKRREGARITSNCRDGHDCPLQVGPGGLAHAQQFNHLCKPYGVPQLSLRR